METINLDEIQKTKPKVRNLNFSERGLIITLQGGNQKLFLCECGSSKFSKGSFHLRCLQCQRMVILLPENLS